MFGDEPFLSRVGVDEGGGGVGGWGCGRLLGKAAILSTPGQIFV